MLEACPHVRLLCCGMWSRVVPALAMHVTVRMQGALVGLAGRTAFPGSSYAPCVALVVSAVPAHGRLRVCTRGGSACCGPVTGTAQTGPVGTNISSGALSSSLQLAPLSLEGAQLLLQRPVVTADVATSSLLLTAAVVA